MLLCFGVMNTSNYISIFEPGQWMTGALIETGADTEVAKRHSLNNIYDLAGNAGEWSTEQYIVNGEYRISGGTYQGSAIFIDFNELVLYGTKGEDRTSSRPILYK